MISRQTSFFAKNIFRHPPPASKSFIGQVPKMLYSPTVALGASFSTYPISPNFINKNTLPITRRALSTLGQKTSPNLIEESMSKIEKNPGAAPDIIRSLSLGARKELALALAEKNPVEVVKNIQLFEIEDEKTRIELFNSVRKNYPPGSDPAIWYCYFKDGFKHFKIQDKDFKIKMAVIFSQYLTDLPGIFYSLNITDPEIKEAVFLSMSEKKPYKLAFYEGRNIAVSLKKLGIENTDFKEKIILNLAKNIPYDNYDGLFLLTEQLPILTDSLQCREAAALIIAERFPEYLDPKLLIPLNLPEDALERILSKMIPYANTGNRLTNIIRWLPNLNEKHLHLIAASVLRISDSSPSSLISYLKFLNISEEILLKIIPKIASEIKSGVDLKNFAEEVSSLGIEPTFILKTTLSILKTNPSSLPGNLAPLNLSSDVLKPILSELIDKLLTQFSVKKLVGELPKLSVANDMEFIEDITLSMLKKGLREYPYLLVGHLKSLHLKEETLKTIITSIITEDSKYLSQFNETFSVSTQKDTYRNLVQELFTLGIQDQNFIDETLLAISEKCPTSRIGNLKNLNIQNNSRFNNTISRAIQGCTANDFFLLIDDLSGLNASKEEFIIPILEITLLLNLGHPKVIELIRSDSATGISPFMQKLGIEDLTLRKSIAKNSLRDSSLRTYSHLNWLGMKKPRIFKEILTELITKERTSPNLLTNLAQFTDFIDDPSFFIDRWDFEAKRLIALTPSSSESASASEKWEKSKELFLQFLQKPEIQNSLNQKPESVFKTCLLSTLFKLDRTLSTPSDALTELFGLINTIPSPSLAEITGNFILLDITSSRYDYYSYENRLNELSNLNIENPNFFEKTALSIAKTYPQFLISTIKKLNISNVKILEEVGAILLAKDTRSFFEYQDYMKPSQKSLLSILTAYGVELHKEKKCILPLKALTEIFSQVVKYQNEALSKAYLQTLLNNLPSIPYQTALGHYTLTGKTKENIISIHKILPAIFFAKWDSNKENVLSRGLLSEFLENSDIRIALRNSVGKSLLQNLLLAASNLDKDYSSNNSDKLNLFAKVCNLQKDQKFPTPSIKELSDSLRILNFFASLRLTYTLDYEFTQSAFKELSTVFKRVAIDNSLVPELGKIEDIEKKYTDLFIENALIPGGLASYEANIRSLPPSKEFIHDLTRFVLMTLAGTYKTERYRTDINPNLLELAERFPEVFKRWQEPLPPIILESSKTSREPVAIKDLSFISSIEEELHEYKEENQKTLVEKIRANLSTLSKTSSKPQEQLNLLNLIEKDLLLLDLIPADALKVIEKAGFSINSVSSKQKYTSGVVNYPLTLFELPTLVCYSCQNITASASLNQCLISYAIEGSIQMVAVQDDSKNFLARSVLRILFDETSQPFLLLEPVYSSLKIDPEEARKAILEMSLLEAEHIGIKLFTKAREGYPGLIKTIESRGFSIENRYYSDSFFDESGSHVISGKPIQKLTSSLLEEVTRETFSKPTFWPSNS
ncbi:MAG: hypothetical protein V4489_02350 [Chlamydiota bacterium]